MSGEHPTKKSRSVPMLEADGATVNRSQLNSSSSKMQYSIGKANRFPKEKDDKRLNKFYDIPDTKSKRSASFGYGNKMELGKVNFKVPSPNAYSFHSDFEPSKKGITISAGREVIKNNSAFQTPSNIPGPGQYEPKVISLGEGGKQKGYSIKSRQADLSDKWLKSIPGPGNYETLQLLDKNMKSLNSKVPNIHSAKFPKSARVSDIDMNIKKKVPGPGNYDKSDNVTATAKFPSQGGFKFSHSPRRGIIDNTKTKVPGPGAYQSFSEFIH